MASPEFCYNVAYTVKANEGATPENRLSRQELWQGIKRGGRYPGDFADFVRSCEVLSGKRNQFVREIVIGDGAVHTKDGTKIVQDVFIQDDLFVRLPSVPLATTIYLLTDRVASRSPPLPVKMEPKAR
jgi:hypothetical protein